MESNDNLMDIKEDDLKFVPLKVENPFSSNESDWLPLVNLDSPNINNFINNFIFGFSTPIVPAKIDDNFYKDIGYFNDNQNCIKCSELNQEDNLQGYSQVGNNQLNMGYNQPGYNQDNMGYNQGGNNQINMGYSQGAYNQPDMGEIQSGYNQGNIGNNQSNQQGNKIASNCNNLGVNYQQYPKEAYGQEMISYEKGYISEFNNLNEGLSREEDIEDLPHIKILKEYDFLELTEENLRDSNKEEINNIFSRIESLDNSILNTFKLYDIPYPMASIIVKKIINDVLDYK